MTELGNRLKEARLAKGFSLDDVQSMTKIQKRYLIGIEEGNYASMPGNFYVRAFIKQYSEALGLNPDEIFETYKSEIPVAYHDELPQQLSRVKTHKSINDGNSKILNLLPKILIGVFVVGLASLIYVLVTNHAGNDSNESLSKENDPVKYVKSENLEKAKEVEKKEKEKEKEKEEETAKQKEEEKTPEVVTPTQELSVVQSAGRDTTYELKNADKFVVKLVAKGGDAWVSVKNGKGKTFISDTLRINGTSSQTVDLSAETLATIRVGNAANTEIYINDQKLEYAIPATANVQNIKIQYVLKSE
ncbi:cytoskeletal protein RodZ [Bacillus sp. SLBN-46]|uniref:helix-turn-helix domain-containing protein n=1 Tax=Bacillus sp. SLBN-46 TaxID=3042283 RepID=UPI00285B31EE|nr:RodZ domain-containing protein [Bacillus sp. SLBN-46]MDR6124146.1 cytoskeletal protein RodZ [Bacillus sp. SLBN-46]